MVLESDHHNDEKLMSWNLASGRSGSKSSEMSMRATSEQRLPVSAASDEAATCNRDCWWLQKAFRILDVKADCTCNNRYTFL